MLATLTSKRFTLFLLGALALVLIPASVSKLPLFMSAGRLLLVALAINLGLCTVKRWRHLSGSVMLIHSGVMLILIGSLVSRAGFIATINIYEGGSSATAFRWDRQADLPLGFTLTVNKINRDYYPVAVRVGVVVDGRPGKLYELQTGESFAHGGVQIELLDLDPLMPALHFAVTGADGRRAVQTATQERAANPAGLTLQLVAFQTPVVKRSWVDLTLVTALGPPVSGAAEVNRPLQWQGLRFYHTATSADAYGQAYAGIQIVKDQGIPVVYLGFVFICLGNGLFWFRKIYNRPPARHRSLLNDHVGA